jgi:hypothetical protein
MVDSTDYGWLKEQWDFRLKVHEPGFAAREAIGVGEQLYDPQLGWVEEGGAIFLTDIGGQESRGWDPEKGHGSVLRLHPDGRLEAQIPPGKMGTFMPLCPQRAPDHFGRWGGHCFLTGQESPGRAGARKRHLVFRVGPDDQEMTVFAHVPKAGSINDGVPGAMITGRFGEPGTPQDGFFYVMSLMNCVIYRVCADGGEAEPWLVMAEPLLEHPVMPMHAAYAPHWWGEYAGEFIVGGPVNTTYTDEAESRPTYRYFRIEGESSLEAIPDDAVPCPLRAVEAPPEFGPFGGHVFFVDDGPVNLLHVTMYDEPIPHKGRVFRRDPDGEIHLFADDFQGSSTSFLFDRDRLLMGLLGKSYSTGDFHHPDGSIYEIRYSGS